MLKKASSTKVAKLYLRANVQTNMLSHDYVIHDKDFKKSLDYSMSSIASFARFPIDAHGVETLSWFVENAHDILQLGSDLHAGFVGILNKVESLYQERKKYEDGSKEAKAVSDAYHHINITLKSYVLQKVLAQYFFDKNVVEGLRNASQSKINIQSLNIFELCAKNLKGFDQLLKSYFQPIRTQLTTFAEALTDESAMQAGKELNPGGVGGFFKKLFRRASMTLVGQLTDMLDVIELKLNSFGLDALNEQHMYNAVRTYQTLAGVQLTHLRLIDSLTKGELFHHYVTNRAHGNLPPINLAPLKMFMVQNGMPLHIMDNNMISRDTLIDGSAIHVAHQHAQKMLAIINHIVK